MDKNFSFGTVVAIALVAVIGAYYMGQNSAKSPSFDPTTSDSPNTQIQATTVQVGTFYDGEDGYTLAIPSGNTSTCIWTYEGGSGQIPDSKTTLARTSTEKHTIYKYDYYNWGVTCVDDFGNRYIGVFPP